MGASGDNDSVKVSRPGRGVESFMNTNGSYDWTRDSAGMYYLRAAQEAGVSPIAFFVNAIPAALTAAKTPSGTDLGVDSIAPFVDYINRVLSYWTSKGVRIDYISPMNEPNNNFADAGQEGMSVATTARAFVYQLLRPVLQSSSSSPAVTSIKVLGDETSQVTSQALVEYPTWLPTTLQNSAIDAIAVHMYDWPDNATLLNYRQLVINTSLPNAPPPLKMTEISTFKSALGIYRPFGWTGPKIFGPGYDPSIDSALDMARLIYIDNNYTNTKDYNYYLPKRFWVFRRFRKFYRPGAVRYNIPNKILPYGIMAVAALGVNKAWSTTFINRNETKQVIKIKVPKVDLKMLAAVQTTQTEDWKSLALRVVGQDGIFSATLPAKGVLTLQFAAEDPASLAGRRRRRTWQERKRRI
ncbi:MAG: hypothetical protein Q9172_001170 [Xanthocarpia lactea]